MRALSCSIAVLLLLFTASCRTAGHHTEVMPDPEQTCVFIAGEDGYHTYRIPAIIATPAGTLLAFCEGRKNNRRDHGDIDLVLKRSSDNGRTWGPLELIYEEGGDADITIGNPCPVVDRSTARIWLPCCRNNDEVLITWSDDDGVTWAPPREITGDVKAEGWSWYATGPGVGIQLEKAPYAGRLVIPCDHREMDGEEKIEKSHIFYSDDHGETWQLGGSAPKYTDECQAVEMADGSLLLNMRNYWERHGRDPAKGGKRAITRSTDGGGTWPDIWYDDTLVEPVCQASFLRYTLAEDGGKNRVLFSNPAQRDKRSAMTVRLSYDEAATWPVAKVLYPGASAYSCLVVLPDGAIGCLYECGVMTCYDTITFARFSLDWLTDGNDRLD
jgi:sialidase-1